MSVQIRNCDMFLRCFLLLLKHGSILLVPSVYILELLLLFFFFCKTPDLLHKLAVLDGVNYIVV